MEVSFYATLREIVGQKTVKVDIPDGATVQVLVDAIIARYPRLRPELLDEKGELLGHIHFFVNGRDVPYLEKQVETVLAIDDVISIFPPVGGG
jgi:sulfur-carrier protein